MPVCLYSRRFVMRPAWLGPEWLEPVFVRERRRVRERLRLKLR